MPERVLKNEYNKITVFKPVGCKKCGDSGYRGRIAIYELLRVTKEIEKLMNQQGGEIEIQEFAIKEGMVTMQQDELLKVASGITTLEEVEKLTGSIQI